MLASVLFFVGSYLLGGVPFGYLVAALRGVDIRKVGSGNIGATNVSRALGKGPGILVFLLDSAKGAVPALVSLAVFRQNGVHLNAHDHATIAGGCAILGHMFSPYLRFFGGKGVATSIGTILALAPPVALAGITAFAICMVLFRIVSLGSLVAVPVLIGAAVFTHQSKVFIAFMVVIGLAVVFKHLENIQRLLKGTERKFSFAKSTESKKEEGQDADKPDR